MGLEEADELFLKGMGKGWAGLSGSSSTWWQFPFPFWQIAWVQKPEGLAYLHCILLRLS
jgi:hypothetical protein